MSVTLNHTGVTVANLDRAEAMFRDLFGFETISRAPRAPELISRVIGVANAQVEIAYMRNGSATIELLCYSQPSDREDFRPRACDLGSVHLGFDVDDMDQALEQAAEWRLQMMGEEVVIDAGPNKGARIVYLRNPDDGLVLELIQRPL